jgi:alkyl hydroperoxide reductase subunit AhpF
MILRFFRSHERQELVQVLTELRRPVQILLFTSVHDDLYSHIVRTLISEFAGLNRLLQLTLLNIDDDRELAASFGISKTPALALLDAQSNCYGVRFYGLPSGYCFPALLEAVLLIGGAAPGSLMLATHAFIDQLSTPIIMQVFASAEEQSCAEVATLAFRLACSSPKITAEVIESRAFPQLVQACRIRETPTLIINNYVSVTGRITEPELLSYLRLGKRSYSSPG